MTRKTTDRVRPSIVVLPVGILEKNKIVTLDEGNFYNNKFPFFISLSQALIFNSVQYLVDRKQHSQLESITLVCQMYCRRGLMVKYINADNEFAHLKQDLVKLVYI